MKALLAELAKHALRAAWPWLLLLLTLSAAAIAAYRWLIPEPVSGPFVCYSFE